MADILTFRFRRSAAPVVTTGVLDSAVLRAELEAAAHAALDQADRLIALLDYMDGEPDAENGADDEPSLGAPERHESQVVWLRGTDRDLETDRSPETRS